MIQAFIDLVNKHQKEGMVVCEVGAWIGATTSGYIDTIKLNRGQSVIVDWFSGNEDITTIPNHIHSYQPNNADSIYSQFVNNLDGYIDIIRVLRGRSADMASELEDESLDICFIDADHRPYFYWNLT